MAFFRGGAPGRVEYLVAVPEVVLKFLLSREDFLALVLYKDLAGGLEEASRGPFRGQLDLVGGASALNGYRQLCARVVRATTYSAHMPSVRFRACGGRVGCTRAQGSGSPDAGDRGTAILPFVGKRLKRISGLLSSCSSCPPMEPVRLPSVTVLRRRKVGLRA